MNTENHFTFLGNGSYINRGCEAIVRGTTEILRKEFGSCRFSSIYMDWDGTNHDKLNESDTSIIHYPIVKRTLNSNQHFSLNWFSRQFRRILFRKPASNNSIYQKIEQIIQEIPSRAILLLGGDNATPGAGGSPDYAFKLLEIARRQKTPVAFWGASIGPFNEDASYERWMIEQLASIDLVCARESITYNYLRSLGLKDNLKLVADPAFFLKPQPFSLSECFSELIREKCIGLNFSPLIGKNYSTIDEWKDRVRRAIEGIAGKFEGPVLLIPHVWKKNNNDFEFMQSVLNSVRNDRRKNIFLFDQPINAAQSKWLIGQMLVFAGARTHATIASISSCVPTLFIGYSSKSHGIAKDTYDNFDWLIDGNNLVADEFTQKILEMINQESNIREHIKTRLPLFHQRALLAAQELKAVIK